MKSTEKIRLQDDFYLHINSLWFCNSKNKLVGKNSPRVKLQSDVLKELLLQTKKLVVKPNKTEDEEKLSMIWTASLKSLNPWILRNIKYDNIIQELKTLDSYIYVGCGVEQIAKYLHYSKTVGVGNILNFFCANNFENSQQMSLMMSISGLSLPSKEYYENESLEVQRKLFIEHLNQIFKLVGENYLSANFAQNVYEFEKELAKYHMTNIQQKKQYDCYTNTTLENVYKNINKLASLTEKELNYDACEQHFMLHYDDLGKAKVFFEALYKCYDFRNILTNNAKKHDLKCNILEDGNIMVIDGDGVRRVVNMILNMDIEKYKSYLQYKIIKKHRFFSTKELENVFFDYYGKTLSGLKKQQTPEMKTISLMNNYVGELMAKLYVSIRLSDKHIDDIKDMAFEIVDTMKKSIINSDWLSESTKRNALDKINKLNVKIGCPEKWRDYPDLKIEKQDTVIEINKKVLNFRYQNFLQKINSKLDRDEWNVLPQQVHANYTRNLNQIIVSLSFLQSPFYYRDKTEIEFDISDEANLVGKDYDFTMGANFGAIGAIIGHEIVHGYDSTGLKYDSCCNINDLFSEDCARIFKEKSYLMYEQVKNYIFSDANTQDDIDAQLTMDENIADVGGLSLALKTLKNKLDGFSEDVKSANIRVFFKSYVNILKKNEIVEQHTHNLINDTHSPAEFRGNLVKNFDEFHEVFDIKEYDKMYLTPKKRIKMW